MGKRKKIGKKKSDVRNSEQNTSLVSPSAASRNRSFCFFVVFFTFSPFLSLSRRSSNVPTQAKISETGQEMEGENMRDVNGKKKMKNKEEDNTPASMAAPVTVVLRVDMHCDGCISRIVSLARRLEGAEKVRAEPASNKLTVIGFFDPSEIAEKLQKKSKKKVELISPLRKNENKPNSEPKSDIKIPAKVGVTTAVLKLSFHCEGCIKKIHKTVSKTKGVHEVTMEKQKEQVTVTGTMDVESLAENLKKKLKRRVGTVPMKREKEKEKEKEKRAESNGDGGGRSKSKKTEAKSGSQPGQPGFAIGPGPYGFPGPVREIFCEEDPDCCCSIM